MNIRLKNTERVRGWEKKKTEKNPENIAKEKNNQRENTWKEE
jgi:hypothetical protein